MFHYRRARPRPPARLRAAGARRDPGPTPRSPGRRGRRPRSRRAPAGLRAPGGQQLEVLRHELRAALLVAVIYRQRQQLAVSVGVDVAGRADEVRDVGPPRAVAVGDLHGVAQQLGLALDPQLAEPLHRQLALAATGGVHEVLEAVHRDLAEDGRDRVLQVLREQRQARGGRGILGQQPPEHDRLGEHRRGLGERQRRALMEHALLGGQREVHAMTELVREREHVAPARGVVEQHVRVHRGHRRGAEGPAALARSQGSVDVALVEEPLRERPQLRGEGASSSRAPPRAPARTCR